ncbi:hypothetical protein MPSEU_000158300 [Mayamaea pseudoterrestris]|nr:hypothetical protein MPSEU_000158300 [Mayamaea pseudoterrestris]
MEGLPLLAALIYLLAQSLTRISSNMSNESLSPPPPISSSNSNSRPQILLMGDSLTQLGFEGWASTLANVYQRRADVLNRGYSGYNTKFYLQLPVETLDNVVLVVIFFGANDAALLEQDAHHHVPVELYKENLKTLYERTRSSTNCNNILFITPPPVHHEQRLAYQKQRYGAKATGVLERTLDHTQRYAAACQQVANELNAPCLDLFNVMLHANKDYGIYLSDGLHFSVDGHELVGEQVLRAIQTHFPQLHVEQDAATGQWCNRSSQCQGLSSQGPYHDEIDANNVAKAFTK